MSKATALRPKPKRPAKRKPSGAAQKTSVQSSTVAAARRLHNPKRTWSRPGTWRYKQVVPGRKPVPKAGVILAAAAKTLRANWKLFGGIMLVYAVLSIVLVRGLTSATDVRQLKSDLTGPGGPSQLSSSLLIFGTLLTGSGNSANAAAGAYQTLLLLGVSLALIWTLRQLSAGHKLRVRDAYYQGMYPLVPFLLVGLLAAVQLLPLVLTAALYATVTTYHIVVHWWEYAGFLVLFAAGALWSLRMVTATLLAFYVVTLPNMAPLQAYRSARQLVQGRRLLVWRKVVFLVVVLVLGLAILEVPLILFAAPVATWAFFVLGLGALPLAYSYLYNLYREML